MKDNQLNVRLKASTFTYFDEWEENTVEELCRVSKVKTFTDGDILLGGLQDRKSYVYFITAGSCRIIECVTLPTKGKSNALTKDKETCFVQVCTLNRLSCFNIGEPLQDRLIVALEDTECLLIPYYWLLEHNSANIWIRTRQFLSMKIPSTGNIIKQVLEERKWREYKTQFVRKKMNRNVENVSINEVPYTCKLNNHNK